MACTAAPPTPPPAPGPGPQPTPSPEPAPTPPSPSPAPPTPAPPMPTPGRQEGDNTVAVPIMVIEVVMALGFLIIISFFGYIGVRYYMRVRGYNTMSPTSSSSEQQHRGHEIVPIPSGHNILPQRPAPQAPTGDLTAAAPNNASYNEPRPTSSGQSGAGGGAGAVGGSFDDAFRFDDISLDVDANSTGIN